MPALVRAERTDKDPGSGRERVAQASFQFSSLHCLLLRILHGLQCRFYLLVHCLSFPLNCYLHESWDPDVSVNTGYLVTSLVPGIQMMLKYLLMNEWTKAIDYLAIDNERILHNALGEKNTSWGGGKMSSKILVLEVNSCRLNQQSTCKEQEGQIGADVSQSVSKGNHVQNICMQC